MAVLTSTVAKCMNNLLHFALLFIVIFLMLAFMSHWMMGDYISEFGSFDTAMYSQMRMFFGEFIKAPEADDLHGIKLAMYWVYAWTFMLVIWLLLLNFLLAIIVDAFVEVKDNFKDKKYMTNIASDIGGVTYTTLVATRKRWPSNKRLVQYFEYVKECSEAGKRAWWRSIQKQHQDEDDEEEGPAGVTPQQLMEAFPEFKTPQSVSAFLLHYFKHASRAIALSEEALAEVERKMSTQQSGSSVGGKVENISVRSVQPADLVGVVPNDS